MKQSILILVADHKETEIVRLLLDHGANLNYVNSNGINALMQAASFDGNKETVRLLLDRGANPNCRDNKGNTPLILSLTKTRDYQLFSKKNEEMVRLLLDRGANPNYVNDKGISALALAIHGGKDSKKIVRLLSDKGASDIFSLTEK